MPCFAGHKLVLLEAQNRLGGAVNIARKAPKSAQIADIVIWLEQEIYRLGVDVRLSTYAERAEVLALIPDAVIVATGSSPRMDSVQAAVTGRRVLGVQQPHVYSAHDIFDVAQDKLGRSAVVVDDVGHYEALGVAEYLVARGIAVNFVTRLASLAPRIDSIQRLEPVLRRLRRGYFALRVRARLIEIGPHDCQVGWLDGDQFETLPADCVVLVGYNTSNTELLRELECDRDRRFVLKVAGDAASPRDLQVAIREGHMAGRFLRTDRTKLRLPD